MRHGNIVEIAIFLDGLDCVLLVHVCVAQMD